MDSLNYLFSIEFQKTIDKLFSLHSVIRTPTPSASRNCYNVMSNIPGVITIFIIIVKCSVIHWKDGELI